MADILPGRRVHSVFFGGGTPSLMPPDTVGAVIEEIAQLWTMPSDVEITLEANPTSVEAGRFAAYAQAGVNRVSMGIQSLRDDDLKRLGRMHTVVEARRAFEIAQKNFSNVSFDLIYARQNQGLLDWQLELQDAIAMGADHLSLYQLTIEPETRFGALFARGKLLGLPQDHLAADLYDVTQDICVAAGLRNYEVSNHAKQGRTCRHNLLYWNYGDYVGIGPGAHGRITFDGQRHATYAQAQPEAWLEQIKRTGTAIDITEVISPIDQAHEYLMMSLRLTEGSDLQRFNAIGQTPLSDKVIDMLCQDGLLKRQGTIIKTSAKGRLLLNRVLEQLLGSRP